MDASSEASRGDVSFPICLWYGVDAISQIPKYIQFSKGEVVISNFQ